MTYIQTLEFLENYNKLKRKCSMLQESLKYYCTYNVNDEIVSRSVSHRAECDNIGAGRNISVSQKTANIALHMDKIKSENQKIIDEIKKEINLITSKLNIINSFCENLNTLDKFIFKKRVFNELSYEEISRLLLEKSNISKSSRTITNKFKNIIIEFADIYSSLNI